MGGPPLVYDLVGVPATSGVVALCCLCWLWLTVRRLGYADIGLSYATVVEQGQYWRGVTASLGHVNLLHLAFNMSSLWSCRFVEMARGSVFYLKFSFLLLALSVVVVLICYHVLLHQFGKEHYRHTFAVGYSCVVFGWVTVVAQWSSASTISLLGFAVPIDLAPFVSLLFTSLLIPNASFLGHLSGILIGYLISWNAFFWFDDSLFLNILVWAVILFVYSFATSHGASVPFLELERPGDVEDQLHLPHVLDRYTPPRQASRFLFLTTTWEVALYLEVGPDGHCPHW